MSIVFYTAPMSSATPVAVALAELGVPHEQVTLDLPRQDTRQAEFLKLNPNGKVPTLVVDGTPMFEALAIMCWLGDRYGTARGLWPAADAPERLSALSWSTWSYVTLVSTLQRYFILSSERTPEAMRHAGQAAVAKQEIDRLLGVLDAHLAKGGYIVGKRYSLADLIVAGVVGYANIGGVSVEGWKHVAPWLAQCMGRESFRKGWGKAA